MSQNATACVAYMDVGKEREQDAVSFAYMEVGKEREQDAVIFTESRSATSGYKFITEQEIAQQPA